MKFNFNFVFSINTVLLLYSFPLLLFGQEDVLVTFTFKSPREYICKIQNVTDHKMTIWFGTDSDGDGNSEVRFDKLVLERDTIQNVFYPLWKSPEVTNYTVRLEPDQTYAISYQESLDLRFIKAKVFIKYFVNSPNSRVGFFEKTFDLTQLREKHIIKCRKNNNSE